MKTACVYHSRDLDGWMSAAIVKHYCISQRVAEEVDFIGYDYGQTIPDLSGYNKVIMCDISFPAKEMEYLGEKLIWIDHHISAILDSESMGYDMTIGSRNTKFSACELTWVYFFPDDRMPELVRLLGRYDCFGHKGTSEEKLVLEFQYGARQMITNYEDAYETLMLTDYDWKSNAHILHILNSGVIIYKYLCTEAKQSYKNGFEVIFENPSIDFSSRTDIKLHPKYKFILVNKERFNPINFGIDYHADGYDGAGCFHYANGKWNFSLYNDNELVDCSQIAKRFGGGGHRGAAGFLLDEIHPILNK